jgi:ABC-type transport system involved in cytochrome bd biosynthesis fused ATPase/permease subunit
MDGGIHVLLLLLLLLLLLFDVDVTLLLLLLLLLFLLLIDLLSSAVWNRAGERVMMDRKENRNDLT